MTTDRSREAAEIKQLQDDLRRRQRRPRGPQRVADIVAQLLAKRGYLQSSGAEQIAEAWREAAGPLAAHSRSGKLRSGVLEVFAADSVTLQELTFAKAQLLKKLRQALPDRNVRDLRLRVGKLD